MTYANLNPGERSLADRFAVAAAWREGKFDTFPEDARNGRAAVRLRELANEIHIPPNIWAEIEPTFSSKDGRWLRAVSDTNRDVGFRTHPLNFAEYLRHLVANLYKQ